MSRKIVGLAVFVVAIAAAAAGAFYLIDAGDDPGSAPQDSFVLVDFTRSGGFTGITQHLLVYSDGEAELTTGGAPTMPRRSSTHSRPRPSSSWSASFLKP